MPCTKKKFLTRAHADAELQRIKRKFVLQSGKASDQRFLETYWCDECHAFHHGRSYKTFRAKQKELNAKPAAPPKQKLHSWSFIRKRIEKIGLQIERDRQKRIDAINQIMESEKAIEQARAEMAALERQIVADYFSGRIR